VKARPTESQKDLLLVLPKEIRKAL
jgi:hypothetical protein